MRSITIAVLTFAVFAGTPDFADAKRLGGSKSIGKAVPAGTAAAPAAVTSAAPKPAGGTGRVIAGAAAGAAVGVVAGAAIANSSSASAAPAQVAPVPAPAAGAPGMSRGVNAAEVALRRLDEEAAREKAGKPVVAKSAAERRREKMEADEKAAQEQRETLRRDQLAREMSCQIKPVMTDAEMTHCREVWR